MKRFLIVNCEPSLHWPTQRCASRYNTSYLNDIRTKILVTEIKFKVNSISIREDRISFEVSLHQYLLDLIQRVKTFIQAPRTLKDVLSIWLVYDATMSKLFAFETCLTFSSDVLTNTAQNLCFLGEVLNDWIGSFRGNIVFYFILFFSACYCLHDKSVLFINNGNIQSLYKMNKQENLQISFDFSLQKYPFTPKQNKQPQQIILLFYNFDLYIDYCKRNILIIICSLMKLSKDQYSFELSKNPQDVFPYKYIIIAYIIIKYFFSQYVNFRQLKKTLVYEMPTTLLTYGIKQDEFLLSQAFQNDKLTFRMLRLSIKTLLECLIFTANVIPFIWDNMNKIITTVSMQNEFERAVGFWLIYAFVEKAFMVPFDLYQIFLIERKHIKSTKTINGYIFDLFINAGLSVIVVAPVLYGYIQVVEWGGINYYIVLLILIVFYTVFVERIYPYSTIYFNKFKPIQNQDLKLKIKNLITKTGFPAEQIKMKIDNQHDSHGAQYKGIGNIHFIAVYQSLINTLEPDEVIGVLCHQIGHWYYNHSLKGLILYLIKNVCLFWIYSVFVSNVDILISFGFHKKSIFMGTVLFYELFTPIIATFDFVTLALKRSYQFDSDSYAVKLGYGNDLKNALIRLYVHKSQMVKPDPLYASTNYTHPNLHERVQYIERLMVQMKKLRKKWNQQN